MQPLFHVRQAIAGNVVRRPKPGTVIMNGNVQHAIGKRYADRHLRSVRMFHDIMHRFLHRHGDVMPGLAGNLDFMRQILHMKTAAQLRLLA